MEPTARKYYVLLAFCLLIFSGCSSTRQLKYEGPRETYVTNKIDCKVAIIKLDSTFGKYAIFNASDRTINVHYADAYFNGVNSILNSHFNNVVTVNNIEQAKDYDIIVVPEISIGLAIKYNILVKDNFTETVYVNREYNQIVGSNKSFGYDYLSAVSIGILSPITAPLGTKAVSDDIYNQMNNSMNNFLSLFNDELKLNKYIRSIDYKNRRKITLDKTTVASNTADKESNNIDEQPIKSIYDEFFNAVVVISAGNNLGTGFLINQNGIIATNNHVIGNATKVSVKTRDKKLYIGEIISRDVNKDIALLKINGTGFNCLRLATLDEVSIGTEVIAIGAPQGLEWTLTKGIVSSIRTHNGIKYIQTDAAINAGNSGGPLLLLNSGGVIGINTFGINKQIAEGLTFAIYSDELRKSFPMHIK